jgi:predicted anti-sigma-YlaC factor YlaD
MTNELKNEEPHHAGQLVCLDSKIGDLMEDYLIGELNTFEAAEFREHLLLCFKCQDVYSRFQAIFERIRNKRAGHSGRKPQDGLESAKYKGVESNRYR